MMNRRREVALSLGCSNIGLLFRLDKRTRHIPAMYLTRYLSISLGAFTRSCLATCSNWSDTFANTVKTVRQERLFAKDKGLYQHGCLLRIKGYTNVKSICSWICFISSTFENEQGR